MLRIGIDIRPLQDAARTGIGEYAYEMLSALRRVPDHEYLLFDGWRLRRNGPRVPNKLFHAASFFFGAPRIDDILGGVDVFFSPNLGITALSKHTPHVLTIHDLSFEFFPDCFSVKQRLWHHVVRPRKQCVEAAAILVPSENTRRDVVSYYGVDEKKVHVVQPGLSPIFFEETRDKRQETLARQKYHLPEKYFLFIGAIEPRKNIDGLIEAFVHWKKIHHEHAKNFSLILAGPKGYRADALLRGMLGRDDIQYLGYIPAEDKPGLYAGASLLVYPSFYEGFGFPVLEAFALGTPVVTSNHSSLPDLANGAAYLVNPYTVAEIAEGFERLTVDIALRDRFIVAGRERAKAFDWNASARQVIRIFEFLV